jgi:hypothetical protein
MLSMLGSFEGRQHAGALEATRVSGDTGACRDFAGVSILGYAGGGR